MAAKKHVSSARTLSKGVGAKVHVHQYDWDGLAIHDVLRCKRKRSGGYACSSYIVIYITPRREVLSYLFNAGQLTGGALVESSAFPLGV